MSALGNVLVVDDEAYVRDSLCRMLDGEGWRAIPAEGADEALTRLAVERVDVVVSDLRMPRGDVFEFLAALAGDAAPVPVIVITGVGTVSQAVRAMKAGAFDFLQKPVDPDELVLLVERAAAHRALQREVLDLRETTRRLRSPRGLVGSSASMRVVRERIAQAAPADTPVLLRGEPGTGKQRAAEELHAAGPHPRRRLVRVPCGGGSPEAAELSTLLAGDAGTLLIDEVAALSPEAQAVLTAELERREREPAHEEPRLVAASHADLEADVDAGRLRPDLFWRLNVFPIQLPPLREHREDLPELVAHFLAWVRARRGGERAEPLLPTPDALEVLDAYGWPGNVRELRNVLERAFLVAPEGPLDEALMRSLLEPSLRGPLAEESGRDLHLRTQLDLAEKELVQRALVRAGGLKKQAAYWLGIDPRNLGYYLRKHGL
ncbi:MAG TPA: sigma-54 dependent transcriptional regulator [Planctomycetota bacterium]|nr:sigma-54 dependent transcriptional regulator [Planctomycetota bacterium]